MEHGFQHSQLQSVYHPRNYRLTLWFMVPLFIVVAAVNAYGSFTHPTPLTIFGALLWPALLVQISLHQIRNRLIMSPAGISVAFWGRAATPWSNVESIQPIAPGMLGKLGEVPCLILREPIQTRLWSRARGVPAELKGRVIPLYPNLWDRPFALEQELDGYLKAYSASQAQSAPVDFAAINLRQERLRFWSIALAVIVIGLGMYVYIALSLS